MNTKKNNDGTFNNCFKTTECVPIDYKHNGVPQQVQSCTSTYPSQSNPSGGSCYWDQEFAMDHPPQ